MRFPIAVGGCFVCLVATMVVGNPTTAFADGEQMWLFPAATVILILAASMAFVGLLDAGGRAKGLIFAIVLGAHVALWLLPLPTSPERIGVSFLTLIIVPLAAGLGTYRIIRRRPPDPRRFD